MTKNDFGIWECYVQPSSQGGCAIPHDSMVKITMTLPSGVTIDRIPTWLTRVTQDLNISPVYDGRFWNPPKEQQYQFKNGHAANSVGGLKIYEAHGPFSSILLLWLMSTVGISSPAQRVTTYKEFETDTLPRIKNLGYNCIQM